jgi:hypothetical protein
LPDVGRGGLLAASVFAVTIVTGCVPKLSPLSGAPAPAARLPHAAVAPGRHKIVFNWELRDRDVDTRGEGVARVAAPDSARLDFFLGGGFGGGAAVLIRDSVQIPGGDLIKRLVPPPTLLWAALGRVALPNLPDTVIRVEGETLRADIGRPVAWRLSFHGDSLFRVERVDGGRVAEWIDRSNPSRIHYRDERARRSLQLTVTRTEEVPEFDASIWRIDR